MKSTPGTLSCLALLGVSCATTPAAMVCAIAATSVALAGAPTSLPGGGALDEKTDSAGYRLMHDLGAIPSDCPEGVAAFGAFSVMICGKIDKQLRRDLDEVKRRIDTSLAHGVGSTTSGEVEWTSTGALHSRFFSIGEVFGDLMVNQRSGHVVFQYPLQFDSCLTTRIDAPVNATKNARTPRRIEGSYRAPTYPELARVSLMEAVVALEAVIRTDGTIGEVCVQKVSRPGLGFDEAAKAAVKQWLYEPGTVDGVPVAVPFHIVVSFDLP